MASSLSGTRDTLNKRLVCSGIELCQAQSGDVWSEDTKDQPTFADLEYESKKRKASVRAKMEHPFLFVTRHIGYAKVQYRGLAKNTQRLKLLLGLTNLITVERCFWQPDVGEFAPDTP